VNDETVIVAKDRGSQEANEDAIVELFESRSVILRYEEPAEVDRRTYKGAQDHHGDDI
jgi:hypothetical protein